MTECKTHSSLFALVDSHLSKITLQERRSDDAIKGTDLGNGTGTQSKLFTPDRIFPLPNLGLSESPISSVLANQVANMLLAKEKRQEEEIKKSPKDDDTDEENMFVIDLSKALQAPNASRFNTYTNTVLSSSSSCESLFKLQCMVYEDDTMVEKAKSPEPLLPCVTDLSYILQTKLNKGKCSNFGKVLTSRIRPAAPCYIPEKFKGHVKRFSFNIPSPCDLIKEKLRRPTVSCNHVTNIFEYTQTHSFEPK